jgi:hypothetical protein
MDYWEGKMIKGKVFTAPEVQAILLGNKTMFREVIKVQPTNSEQKLFVTISGNKRRHNRCSWLECDDKLNVKSRSDYFKYPYEVGQKIFCKESFNIFAGQVAYKQNLANAEKYFWKPATQMKQEHSRLTLQIKEIRVERLKDINEEDCINEGFDYDWLEGKGNILIAGSITNNFEKYWDSTHKKPEEKFGANPFVWSIRFEVVK